MPVDNSIVSGFAEIVNQAKQSNVFYKKDKEFAQLQDNVALLSSPPNPNVKITALVKGDWTDMPGQSSVKLFAAKTDISSGLAPVAQSPTDFDPNSDYAVTSVDGFIRFGLIGKVYNLDTFLKRFTPPSITTVPANSAASAATGFKVDKVDIPVPDPPVIRSIWVTYSATDDIVLDSTLQSFNSRSNFFYHIEPFGFREMHKAITGDDINLLPVFNLDDKTTNDDGGELWIGLGNAKADETFSILFQVSDGSANPLKNMTEVAWYYLNGDNWLLFKDQAVADQTNNLTRSGLVILTVPPDATTTHTRVDAGLIWVKAVVQKDTDAVCNIIAIDTNAAKAQFVQNIDKKIEFTKALTPNIISKPAISDSALKKTQQPYPSFDGRVKETDSQFYLRVSERLRHKHRAITLWDYERLTLQYFPQIFKAKCLNHTGFVIDDSNVQKYVETLAGHVMVITIPDLTNLSTSNILRPYTSIGLLTEIEKYLQTLTSPFVKVKVCNPQFEEVQFEFNVKFRDGFDPTFFKDHLNDEIEQFLTPWAYGNPQAIAFGNTIEKSVVLNFIEERYYVDFVTCFKMSQIIALDTGVKTIPNIDVAIPSTARSILVSYSNAEHTVRHLISSISSPVNCNC
jgi:hypothetical protein